MGIVDEDSIVLARRGDDLYPALDALRGAQGVRNFSKRNVQCQRGGNDAEGVIDAENAGCGNQMGWDTVDSNIFTKAAIRLFSTCRGKTTETRSRPVWERLGIIICGA